MIDTKEDAEFFITALISLVDNGYCDNHDFSCNECPLNKREQDSFCTVTAVRTLLRSRGYGVK